MAKLNAKRLGGYVADLAAAVNKARADQGDRERASGLQTLRETSSIWTPELNRAIFGTDNPDPQLRTQIEEIKKRRVARRQAKVKAMQEDMQVLRSMQKSLTPSAYNRMREAMESEFFDVMDAFDKDGLDTTGSGISLDPLEATVKFRTKTDPLPKKEATK